MPATIILYAFFILFLLPFCQWKQLQIQPINLVVFFFLGGHGDHLLPQRFELLDKPPVSRFGKPHGGARDMAIFRRDIVNQEPS